MKLGTGTMLPFSRSPIRLACIAALVLSGIITNVNPIVAGGEIISGMNAPVVEKHAAGHHHHRVASEHHHNEKKVKHGHIKAAKKIVTGHLDAIEFLSHHGRHHNHHHGHHVKHHHRQRHGRHHHHKHGVHHRKKGHHSHKKHGKHHHKGRHHGKHHGKHHNKHCNKDKDKCVNDNLEEGKPRVAKDEREPTSFGILICENKTISAVYCPKGTLTRPGAELRSLAQLYAANIPDALSAMNNHIPKPVPYVNSTYSKKLAFYDIIEMQAPCPRPAYADIAAAVKQLTCADRKLMSAMFNLYHYSTEEMMSIELRNTGGHGNCTNGGGVWGDKCTSKGTFCGIDIFGCNTIDDGLYSCMTIGQKPTLLEICPLGGCVSIPAAIGPSQCRHGDCECAGTGQVCGSEFPLTCRYDSSSLYFCKGSGNIPVALHKCPTGECPRGATECPNPPIDDTCLCKSPGPICGATFDSSCKIDKTSLYTCGAKGDTPKLLINCESMSCRSGFDSCDPIPPTPGTECDCQKVGEICGASFPSKCNLDAGTLYTCAKKGDKPFNGEKCDSNSCPNGADKCDAIPIPCRCKAAGKICGSTYPTSCGLRANWLYTCSAAGVLPVFHDDCDSGICKSGGTECEETPIPPDQCECSSIGKICGSTFPGICGYDSASLYTCDKEGGKPSAPEKCASNSCKSGNSKCDDNPDPNPEECKCKEKGMICGASFPRSCGHEASHLLFCESKDAIPISYRKCESNSCPAGNLKCDPLPINNDCNCKIVGKICGSTFPAKCGYYAGSLLTCVQKDLPPASSEKCKSNKCKSGENACDPPGPGPDECRCKAVGELCGSSYPAKCGFDAGSLYKCSQIGLEPTSSVRCPSNICKSGNAHCDPNVCHCPARGSICGSTFPLVCGYDVQGLYICGDKDEEPKFVEKCVHACKSDNSGCEPPDPCACMEDSKNICGSSFVSTCSLDAGTLYKCVKGEKPTEVVEKCVSNSCKAGSDKCDEPPIPLECRCKNNNKICGSSFPVECGWDSASLYECRGADDTPTLLEKCESNSCPKGTSECEEDMDRCLCLAAGKVCGSSFPSNCGFHSAYLYICEARGDIPKVYEMCKSNSCPMGSPKCDDFVTPGEKDCKCKSSGKICGSSFPLICAFDAGSLYECSGADADPTIVKKCPSNNCKRFQIDCEPEIQPDPCLCFAKGDICGSTFHLACKLDSATLYKCTGAGAKPTDPERCESNSCTSGGTECDGLEPTGDCKCKATGTICSDTFPSSCGLTPKSLYDCEIRMDPEFLYTCKSGSCKAGSVACEINECQCTAEQDLVCGSFFPAKCKIDPAALFVCTGNWTVPEITEHCESGSCPPDASKCDPGPCDCSSTGDICGATFPEICDLSASALYRCENAGSKPSLIRECLSKECLKDERKCTPNECSCSDKGDVCGTDFPAKCAYDKGTLYNCAAKGDDPTVKTNCNSGSCPKDTGACGNGECSCTADGDVCGSGFPGECGYALPGIYTCGEAGTIPIFDHLCTSGTCNKAKGHCDPGKCDCTRVGPICGSTFPEDCGYTGAAVYTCDEIGLVPQLDKNCKSKVCESGESACGVDPCACKSPGRLCGITYPESCGLLKDTIYSCLAQKNETMPNPKEHCPTGCVFGADKCNPTDLCKCGSSFPYSCGFSKDVLYDCKYLEKPVHSEDCIADTCLPNSDKCTVVDDSCLCKEMGLICGSSFPSQCKTDRNSLYKCTAKGSQPVFEAKCPSGACPINSDKCSDLKVCICEKAGDICGSTFDETCGFAKGSLYTFADRLSTQNARSATPRFIPFAH
ncbi:MAG: hypothetical protein J3R72DRAFT_500810 [Linnemannia gamsii]|nr:MAG: hypothetical protein J3R72DRAFT_500810 [Linnemannia gamsii]